MISQEELALAKVIYAALDTYANENGHWMLPLRPGVSESEALQDVSYDGQIDLMAVAQAIHTYWRLWPRDPREFSTQKCAGCLRGVLGDASIDGKPYCHPDDESELDCYHMATVYSWTRESFDLFLHTKRMHPDYEYETTETARKSGESRMPEGEGWEPNNIIRMPKYESGSVVGWYPPRNWERFEFTEEEYWKRKKS